MEALIFQHSLQNVMRNAAIHKRFLIDPHTRICAESVFTEIGKGTVIILLDLRGRKPQLFMKQLLGYIRHELIDLIIRRTFDCGIPSSEPLRCAEMILE